MRKLEFALLILGSFEISAGAYYLMGKLSKKSVVKLVVSLAALTSSILIIRPLLERYPIPTSYRTWCGVIVFLCVGLAIFAWIFLWAQGDLEGEGLWHKTSLLAGGIGLFSAFSLIVSAIFILAMTGRIFVVASVVIVFLVGPVLVFLSLRRTYYRLRYYAKTDERIYFRSVLVSLSRVALVRVALLIFIAVPVFLISTEVERLWVSAALIVYVSLEVLVIDFQLRGVHRAVDLLSRSAS